MAYKLDSLVKIRLRREDAARSELAVARSRVEQAERDLAARKDELRRYEETREERRDRIYAAIIGRSVSQEELELAREGIARIDEEGSLKADNVVRAGDFLKEREREAGAAAGRFAAATRNRMKIDEHRGEWLRSEAELDERRQEIELEDFTGKKVTDDRDV